MPHTTVAGYYQILEDRLIAKRIEALSESRTPSPFKVGDRIHAVHWQEIPTLLERIA